MQHVEFFNRDHFEDNYHRARPTGTLGLYIDFVWETSFDDLWSLYPEGFSDVLFPNIGYTYLVNLGTPFVMQVDKEPFEMKTDGFLPRPTSIECFHRRDNHLFGIKFRTSPVMLEKKINFREYKGFIFPLSYLADPSMIDAIKKAKDFSERAKIVFDHYEALILSAGESSKEIPVVTSILEECFKTNDFTVSVELLAKHHNISSRTLQRYFEKCTGVSSKQALQIMRIRKAADHLANHPQTFRYSDYGYYDYSHFYKHLKSFLQKETLSNLKPHLLLLGKMHKKAS